MNNDGYLLLNMEAPTNHTPFDEQRLMPNPQPPPHLWADPGSVRLRKRSGEIILNCHK